MPRSRVRLLLLSLLLGTPAAAASFVACIPTYTFGEGAVADGGSDATTLGDATSGDDATADALADVGADATAPVDARADVVVPPFDASNPAVAIADAGSKTSSTGFGYQQHLVFAENDGRYWYFYVDDTAGVIKTLASADFATWTPGATIALGTGYGIADGYSFSVAYANLGGNDVVHFVVNATDTSGYATLHIRATISAGTLTPSAQTTLPDTTNGSPCANDGPATTITPSGQVFDVTAWALHSAENTSCDTNIYLAPGIDTGTSWNAGTFSHDGYYVSYPELAFSHDLIALPDAGTVMVLFPDQDDDSTYDYLSMGWALSPSFSGGAPGTNGVFADASAELFTSANQPSSYDDWSACRLGGSEVHVVRHVLVGDQDQSFEEEVYAGGSWQTTASPPAASASLAQSGLVLLSNADPSNGMLMITLGTNNALNIAKWTTSGGWVAAGGIAADGNARQSLAGSACGGARPTVFWTETIGSANVIESADLSGLL